MSAPAISRPRGGGAIRGIGETFTVVPASGTSALSVPIVTSPGRSGFQPQLALQYDSGSGNGPFGFGWSLTLPSVSRRTDRRLPRYQDPTDSDTFVLTGAEELVPFLRRAGGEWVREVHRRAAFGQQWIVHRHRPRTEGLFARIEHWRAPDGTGSHWRVVTRDDVTSLYGLTAGSRVADPDDQSKIFEWLLDRSYDDKGNVIAYAYKPEDAVGVDGSHPQERRRVTAGRFAQRYVKRIKYGNVTPFRRGATPFDITFGDGPADWLFEVLFDYGEHDDDLPQPSDDPAVGNSRRWPVRADAFSNCRPGFDLRTYRLCRRVLMFHHIPDLAGGEPGYDGLVRSTDLTYRESPVGSFLESVTQTGYDRQPGQSYIRRSLPPLRFGYSGVVIDERVHELGPDSVANLAGGIDGAEHRWVDLDGEGLNGILTEQSDGWFYNRNLSPTHRSAHFDPPEPAASKPNASLANRQGQLLDLAGDGQLDVAVLDGSWRGFYERTEDAGWHSFRTFGTFPNGDTGDPHLRLVDLDGDGLADLLVSEDEMFRWHGSLEEEGFGPAVVVPFASAENDGPRVVFADTTGSLFLADMSGDGLSDVVRIRDGEVCYWPNLGYGRFGPKVTMDDPPRFDHPERFDATRIRLGDIDGSGTTDVFYLDGVSVRFWFNQSGNSFAAEQRLSAFPETNDLTSVSVIDLLGNGTGCLVWSSPLPADAGRPLRYVDLTGGQKPHLLTRLTNNLGAETVVTYACSTRFFVADRQAGRPWITRLPFPVHVVETTENHDHISGSRLVTRYEYHHGFYDGVEREFRGFGLVDRHDTEDLGSVTAGRDATSHVPPTLTRTWFHTGAHLGRDRISRQYTGEYYREPGLSDAGFDAQLLPDTIVPPGLSLEEERQACRALRGSILRQEVYALDGTPDAVHPYTTSEQNYAVELVQPSAGNRHAVFVTAPREVVDRQYERDPLDPRVRHQLTLETDEFGDVLHSATVAYGRLHPDPELAPKDQATQAETLLTCVENQFTNAIDTVDAHRTPLLAEMRTFQLTGLVRAAGRFAFDEVREATRSARRLDYEQMPPAVGLHKRVVEHVRVRYRPDDLGAAVNDSSSLLGVGELEALALPGETYTLALTPGLLAGVMLRDRAGQPPEVLVPDPADVLGRGGGYVDLDGFGHWWVPSGRIFYSPDRADGPAEELTHARAHFFLPHRSRDPFDTPVSPIETSIGYDTHDLLVQETSDPLGNRVTVGERGGRPGHDYRVLQPQLVTDPEGTRSAVVFDALGMVVATALMGAVGEDVGDRLDGFTVADANPTPAEVERFLADPAGTAADLLQRATSRVVYDIDRYQRCRQPPLVATLVREIHVSELAEGEQSRVRVSFVYGDGFGRELQTKVQAEPGDCPQRGPGVVPPNGCVQPGPLVRAADGGLVVDHADRRWVGSGRTVYDNKGNPVRRYEPFFSATHLYEPEPEITDTGVSSDMFYDPVGRVVATLHPNHTYEKVVFDPWRQATWDVNDTVALDPRTDPDVRDLTNAYFVASAAAGGRWETWHAARVGGALGDSERDAAVKAETHAATPTIAHADPLGRPFLTVADNGEVDGVRQRHPTRVTRDIEGHQREVADAKGRVVIRFDHDMAGNVLHQASMDAGERWTLGDVRGNPLRTWDSRGHRLRVEYDQLGRPVRRWVLGADGAASDPRTVGREVLFERTDYRGTRVHRQYDSAGVVINERFDFKGNLLETSRQLTEDHAALPDWSAGPPAMQPERHRSITAFDALNRPVTMRSPDRSVIRHTYNEAGLLETVEVNVRGEEVAGAPVWRPFVTSIDYDAKGQRTLVAHDNGVQTQYRYDPETFRLRNLSTTRPNAPAGLQDLHYTYDPVGNITAIRDLAQQRIFFDNRVVEPSSEYTYDALYQLTRATGREHLGQNAAGNRLPPTPTSYNDRPRTGLPHPGDRSAMGTYVEEYIYDEVGNLLAVGHRGTDPRHPGWRRDYAYNEASLVGPGPSNRLTSTLLRRAGAAVEPEPYTHDAHGNMTAMPQLRAMQWDFRDQLVMTRRQAVNAVDDDGRQRTGERTYYVYDGSGARVRKVTERAGGGVKDERIYLGGCEIYRRHGVNEVVRETLHVMDGERRIALVDTRISGDEPGVPQELTRHQLDNHLGSAAIELDGAAEIISYEEYYPYGCTSYQAVRSQTEAPNRYRYTAKERDEETGLCYHGARYYASWLGRWTSADPAGLVDGPNLYWYARDNPVALVDRNGTNPQDPLRRFNEIGEELARRVTEYETALDAYEADVAARSSSKPFLPNKELANRLRDAERNLSPEYLEATAREVHDLDPAFKQAIADAKKRGLEIKEARAGELSISKQPGGDVSVDPRGRQGKVITDAEVVRPAEKILAGPRELGAVTPTVGELRAGRTSAKELRSALKSGAKEAAKDARRVARPLLAPRLTGFRGLLRRIGIIPLASLTFALLFYDPNDPYNIGENRFSEAILGEFSPEGFARDILLAVDLYMELLDKFALGTLEFYGSPQ